VNGATGMSDMAGKAVTGSGRAERERARYNEATGGSGHGRQSGEGSRSSAAGSCRDTKRITAASTLLALSTS
jgi:hypothetical protein